MLRDENNLRDRAVCDNFREVGSVLEKMTREEIGRVCGFMASREFFRMAFLWIFSLLSSYFLLFSKYFLFLNPVFYPRSSSSSISHSGTSSMPICVITGATSGLGAAAAHALSMEGYCVVLVGRCSNLLSETIAKIKKQNKDAHIKPFEADLSSFQSILRLTESIKLWLSNSKMHPSIQILINNAGILATSSRFTVDGYDQMMATNYLGPFFFTKLLIPLLENSPIPSRIVNVSSFTHRNVQNTPVNAETVSGRGFSMQKQYPFSHVYEYSKFCLLVFAKEFHRRRQFMDKPHWISINVADPGVSETNIMREVPSVVARTAFTLLKLCHLLKQPEDAVCSVLDAAMTHPEVSGMYFFGGEGRTISPSALSCDAALALRLWATTTRLCGINSSASSTPLP